MLLLLVALPVLSTAEADSPSAQDEQKSFGKKLADRAAVIKPSDKELAWLQIPWVLDLQAAQETAKAEGRPIFLWVTGDDPLERC